MNYARYEQIPFPAPECRDQGRNHEISVINLYNGDCQGLFGEAGITEKSLKWFRSGQS